MTTINDRSGGGMQEVDHQGARPQRPVKPQKYGPVPDMENALVGMLSRSYHPAHQALGAKMRTEMDNKGAAFRSRKTK